MKRRTALLLAILVSAATWGVIGFATRALSQTQAPSSDEAPAEHRLHPILWFQARCGGKTVTWVQGLDENGQPFIRRFEAEHPAGEWYPAMIANVPGDSYDLCAK